MSIFEILHTVGRYSQFTGALTHQMEYNHQPVLPAKVNLATLIGWGRPSVANSRGVRIEEAEFVGGQVREGNRSHPLGNAAKAAELVVTDEMTYGTLYREYVQDIFGAHHIAYRHDGARVDRHCREEGEAGQSTGVSVQFRV